MFFRKKSFTNTGKSVQFIICGLGNPGTKYENTRHNCGFMVIDDLAKKYGVSVKRLKFKSLTGEVSIGGVRVLLMKPTTYMNLSGQAVTEAMRFYKVESPNVLILCDDINLEVGTVRIREKGSDGGQKGLRNIIYLSGKDDFPRVRIGVGNPRNDGRTDYDLADWVTSPFPKSDAKGIEFALANALSAAEMIVGGDLQGAGNRYNGKTMNSE